MSPSELDRLVAASVSRRGFLGGVGALAGFALTAKYAPFAAAQPKFSANPFSLGVASGDPLPDSVVLWTRLAPDPLNGGGLAPEDYRVRWQIAVDESMKRIVQQGTAPAPAALGHSVHVEVGGLQPGRHYWYQFESGGVVSPVGRTKTAPDYRSRPNHLAFAFCSCQAWHGGYYAAFQHMAQQDLDLVLHLGDYIYEANIAEKTSRSYSVPGNVRAEPMDLNGYRLRYALYKMDPQLQAVHAAFPFVVTWDDHEVDNNYAASIDRKVNWPGIFRMRRAAAYQAYYENMPLRAPAIPNGPDMQLYRQLNYGDLAEFFVLDTRQYRSDQANGDGFKPMTPEVLDPRRTLLGFHQENWLYNGLSGSEAIWNVLAQQLIMAQFERGPNINLDGWDGYRGERNRLLNFLGSAGVKNPVVISGDSHTNLIGHLKQDFENPKSKTVGVEFAGTSISSGGIKVEDKAKFDAYVAAEPHLKWFEGTKRGYVRCELNRKQWRSDVLQVEDILKADSPVTVGSSWVVENGRAELLKV